MDLAFFGTAGIKKKQKALEVPNTEVYDRPVSPLRGNGANLKQEAVSELG